MTGMGNFVFNGQFVESTEVRTHSTRNFFLQDHDDRIRVRARTRTDKSCNKEFLDHFLNFIFLCKGVAIRMYIGRKASGHKGNGVIMNTAGRRESLGSGKYHLMFRKKVLEVLWHKRCLSFLYGMELGNDTRLTFFEHLFHAMGTNDLK
jgi:hypothetical protein